MLPSARPRPGQNFSINALLILSFAAGAIWLGPASDASARERPHHARKAAKPEPLPGWPPGRSTAPRRGAGVGKGVPARMGTALGEPHRERPDRHRPPAYSERPAIGAHAAPRFERHRLPASANRPAAGSQLGQRDRLERHRSPLLSHRSPTGPQLGQRDRLGRHRSPVLSNRSAAIPHLGHRREWSHAFRGDHQRFRIEHRRSIVIARSRLPHRPFPGERGFTGVPVAGEARYVRNEVMLQVGADVSQQTVDAVARKLGLSTVGSQSFGLTGGTLMNFRIADGRRIDDVVRALETENIGVAQPEYVYTLQQDKRSAARAPSEGPGQYVVNKLRLAEVHRVATGSNVVVAVIDSEIDAKHPDLDGAVVDRFDAGGRRGEPHAHGTGMAGAVAARRRLTGIAPGAKILAVNAFSPEAKEAPQATTRHILAGIEWAIKKGARVINMSFAGPYDPMLQLAIKRAHEKGVVLIAAAGNLGPKSPPLYPAADPHVIAVTATDQGDRIFSQANQGPHLAVSAPGVDILEPAPNSGYQLTTGTSVAAAHVSGVAALLIERDPSLDPAAIHEILTATAKDGGSQGRDDKFGWGLVDPSRALQELDAKLAQEREAPAQAAPAKPAASKPTPMSAR
jgi:hypothetical protein